MAFLVHPFFLTFIFSCASSLLIPSLFDSLSRLTSLIYPTFPSLSIRSFILSLSLLSASLYPFFPRLPILSFLLSVSLVSLSPYPSTPPSLFHFSSYPFSPFPIPLFFMSFPSSSVYPSTLLSLSLLSSSSPNPTLPLPIASLLILSSLSQSLLIPSPLSSSRYPPFLLLSLAPGASARIARLLHTGTSFPFVFPSLTPPPPSHPPLVCLLLMLLITSWKTPLLLSCSDSLQDLFRKVYLFSCFPFHKIIGQRMLSPEVVVIIQVLRETLGRARSLCSKIPSFFHSQGRFLMF